MRKLSYYQNITPSNSQKQKARELKDDGHSLRAIAKKLGVGKSTVERWLKEASSSGSPSKNHDLPDNSSEIPGKSLENSLSKSVRSEGSQPPQGTKDKSGHASERVAMRKLELEHERELRRIDLENKRLWQEKEERSNKTLIGLVRPVQWWAKEELIKASDCPDGVPCLVSDIHDMHNLLGKFHKKLSSFQERTNNWRALDYAESLTFLLLTTEDWSNNVKRTYKEELSGEYELAYKWNSLDIQYVEQLAEDV